MAAVTWDDVVNHAPELATGVSAGAQADILAHVNGTVNVALFGGEDSHRVKLIRVYLAAHLGTLDKSRGNIASTSGVTSESAGGLSRSYAIIPGDSSAMSSTSYGKEYLRLIKIARLPFAL